MGGIDPCGVSLWVASILEGVCGWHRSLRVSVGGIDPTQFFSITGMFYIYKVPKKTNI